jgi:hypothetical protein
VEVIPGRSVVDRLALNEEVGRSTRPLGTVLPSRLTVSHLPLKQGIHVRIVAGEPRSPQRPGPTRRAAAASVVESWRRL